MRGDWRKCLFALLAALFMALSLTTPAYAATKTIKSANFNTLRAPVERRATEVRRGTSRLVIVKGKGYAKFKAPATKVYTFTFSDVACAKGGSSAYFSVLTSRSYSSTKYIGQTLVATQGGKAKVLRLSMNKRADTTSSRGIDRRIATRYAKIRLRKGETVFIYFNNSMKAKTTALLAIK